MDWQGLKMNNFVLSGKAKTVFALLALKAKREREFYAMVNKGKKTVNPFQELQDIINIRGVETQPHEKLNPAAVVICPFSRCLFLCPLEKRLKCAGLECDYWVNKRNEGEN